MAQSIIQWSKLEVADFVKNLRVSEPRQNANGMGKSVNITYVDATGNAVRPVVQTPKLQAPFGISTYESKDGTKSYSLVLSFKNAESDLRIQKFLKLLKAVDELVLDAANSDQTAWLGFTAPKDRAIVEDRHMRCLQEDDTGKWPAKLRAKVDIRDGKFNGIIIDASNKQIDFTEVEKNGFAIALLELSSAWATSGRFGVSLRAVQIKTFPIARLDYVAIVDDEADRNCIEVTHADRDVAATQVDDYDEDSDPSEEPGQKRMKTDDKDEKRQMYVDSEGELETDG